MHHRSAEEVCHFVVLVNVVLACVFDLEAIEKLRKIKGEDNPSDILTKGVKPEILQRHLHHYGLTSVEEEVFHDC